MGVIAAVLAGSTLAAATVFGVVSSQSDVPEQSPVDAEQPMVDYGSTE